MEYLNVQLEQDDLEKLRYIAAHEGRSPEDHLVYLIEQSLRGHDETALNRPLPDAQAPQD